MHGRQILLALASAFVMTTTTNKGSVAVATETKGWLRERIEAGIKKRLQEAPAPELSVGVGAKIEKPGTYTLSLKHGGQDRYYMLHVPLQYKSTSPAPVVFALHGGGGDMSIQSSDEYYKLISKSDSSGYIVIFPNGSSQFKSGKLATWNAGKCCGGARDKKIDDVGFIKAVLDRTATQLNIDLKKVFAMGMSNGAMMSYRLACELAGSFTAIAAVAGTDNTIECKPSQPISVLHIHAKNDDHVIFSGGAGKPFAKNPAMVNDFTSVPATISKWVKFNGCQPLAKKVLEKPQASCEKFSGCKNQVEVELCVTETGGHSWPGGKKPRDRGNESPSTAISANDVAWAFFAQVAAPKPGPLPGP